jgi:hypothetical protein
MQWIDRATAGYLPWWKNASYIKTVPADEQVLTALWLQKGKKALLCLSNLYHQPRRIVVTLALPKMGMEKVTIEDALTGEKISSAGSTFSVEVDYERFRLLKIMPQVSSAPRSLRERSDGG